MTEAVQIWTELNLLFLAAGIVGAFGNQVVYWRRRDRPVNKRTVCVSFGYILTGGGVGFFVGFESGVMLLSLGSGAAWPATLKSIDAARNVGALVKKRLDSSAGPPDAAGGGLAG